MTYQATRVSVEKSEAGIFGMATKITRQRAHRWRETPSTTRPLIMPATIWTTSTMQKSSLTCVAVMTRGEAWSDEARKTAAVRVHESREQKLSAHCTSAKATMMTTTQYQPVNE